MAELASPGSLADHAYCYHQFDWSEAESGALSLKRRYKNSLQDSACSLFCDVTIGVADKFMAVREIPRQSAGRGMIY